MRIGVVYKFKPHNKLNGTLFYCYEYYRQLRKVYPQAKFLIVGIDEANLGLVEKVFHEKYENFYPMDLRPVRTVIDLWKIKLDRTLILDIDTFYQCKEFCTNDVHVFSNDTHEMYRYPDYRTVTYYGIYPYQRFDVECMLKLNFDIMRKSESKPGVFVSCLDMTHLKNNINRYEKEFERPIILKKSHEGSGSIFDDIDQVHYVHVQRDTNNRIIPEAFFHNKELTIEEVYNEDDSIMRRYNDIVDNGLDNYTLTLQDKMIEACLQ